MRRTAASAAPAPATRLRLQRSRGADTDLAMRSAAPVRRIVAPSKATIALADGGCAAQTHRLRQHRWPADSQRMQHLR